jgi:hypothetical protein
VHELRYWNGSSWIEHVSDQGTTGQDPLTTELPPPADAYPPPPASPPQTSGGKPSWKDPLKQVADQGKQKLAGQQSRRTEQWANDPNTRWFGETKNAATRIERGLLGTRTESVPLWSIKDMDVRQAVWQRGNDIGDVVLNLEDPTYGAGLDTVNLRGNVEGTTSGQVVLDNIESPYAVLDVLIPADQRGPVEEDDRAAVPVPAREPRYGRGAPGTCGSPGAGRAPARPPRRRDPDGGRVRRAEG